MEREVAVELAADEVAAAREAVAATKARLRAATMEAPAVPPCSDPGARPWRLGDPPPPTRLTGPLATLAKDAQAYLAAERKSQEMHQTTAADVQKLQLAFQNLSVYLVGEVGAMQQAHRQQQDEAVAERRRLLQHVASLRREVESLQAAQAEASRAGSVREELRRLETQQQDEHQALRDSMSAVRRFAEQQAREVRAMALQARSKADEAARSLDARAHAESARAEALEASLAAARQEIGELREELAGLTLDASEMRRVLMMTAHQRVQGAADKLSAWAPSWEAERF